MAVNFSGLIKPTGRIHVGSGTPVDTGHAYEEILKGYDVVIGVAPDSEASVLSDSMSLVDAVKALPDTGGAIRLGEGVYNIATDDFVPTNGYHGGVLHDYGKEVAFIGMPGKTIFRHTHVGARDSNIWICENPNTLAMGITFDNMVLGRTASYSVAVFGINCAGWWYNCAYRPWDDEEQATLGRFSLIYNNSANSILNVRHSTFAASFAYAPYNGYTAEVSFKKCAVTCAYTRSNYSEQMVSVDCNDPLNGDYTIVADNSDMGGIGTDDNVGVNSGYYAWNKNTAAQPLLLGLERLVHLNNNSIPHSSHSASYNGTYMSSNNLYCTTVAGTHYLDSTPGWNNIDPTVMREHFMDYFFGDEYEVHSMEYSISSWHGQYGACSKFKIVFSNGSEEFIDVQKPQDNPWDTGPFIEFTPRVCSWIRIIPWEVYDDLGTTTNYIPLGFFNFNGRKPTTLARSPLIDRAETFTSSTRYSAGRGAYQAMSGHYSKNDGATQNPDFLWANPNYWNDEELRRSQWWQVDFDQAYTITRIGLAVLTIPSIAQWSELKLIFSDDSEQILSFGDMLAEPVVYADVTPVVSSSVRIIPWTLDNTHGSTNVYAGFAEVELWADGELPDSLIETTSIQSDLDANAVPVPQAPMIEVSNEAPDDIFDPNVPY